MPGPARVGTLIYALHLDRMHAFYAGLLGLRVLAQDAEHIVLQGDGVQLVLCAIPPEHAADVALGTPPTPRNTQALKPFFTVADLTRAEHDVQHLGGGVLPQVWDGPGFRALNVFDPEGNILQLRAFTG